MALESARGVVFDETVIFGWPSLAPFLYSIFALFRDKFWVGRRLTVVEQFDSAGYFGKWRSGAI